jgi:hypothetical protein
LNQPLIDWACTACGGIAWPIEKVRPWSSMWWMTTRLFGAHLL